MFTTFFGTFREPARSTDDPENYDPKCVCGDVIMRTIYIYIYDHNNVYNCIYTVVGILRETRRSIRVYMHTDN